MASPGVRKTASPRLRELIEQADQARTATRTLRTFERRCHIVDVTRDILARTRRPFPAEPLRSLDAIHLATAEFLGEPPMLMTIVTRDVRVERAARAMGYWTA